MVDDSLGGTARVVLTAIFVVAFIVMACHWLLL